LEDHEAVVGAFVKVRGRRKEGGGGRRKGRR
jgi:hypothetical protein